MHINTHVLADVWALHKQSVSVSVCEGRYSWLTRNTTGSWKRSRACTQTDAKTKRCDCKEWWFQRKPMMQRCHHVLVMHRKIMSKCMTHGCQRQLLFFFFFLSAGLCCTWLAKNVFIERMMALFPANVKALFCTLTTCRIWMHITSTCRDLSVCMCD